MNRFDVMDPGVGHVDMLGNLVLLRTDLRASLDAHNWALVPKAGRFVAHFLRTGCGNACADLHNVPATLPPRTPPEFLYARFAHAILGMTHDNRQLAPVAGGPAEHRFADRGSAPDASSDSDSDGSAGPDPDAAVADC